MARGQPEVYCQYTEEYSDRGSIPVQGKYFFSFLLFAINKAYF